MYSIKQNIYIHLETCVRHGVLLSTENVVLVIYCALSVRWLVLLLNFKIWKYV